MEDPVLFQLNVNLKAKNRATCLNLNGEDILNLSDAKMVALNILSDDEVDKLYESFRPLDTDSIIKYLCGKFLQDLDTNIVDMVMISAFSVAKILDQNRGLFIRSKMKVIKIMEDLLSSISDPSDTKEYSELHIFEEIRKFNYQEYSSDSLIAAITTVVDCFTVMKLSGSVSIKEI